MIFSRTFPADTTILADIHGFVHAVLDRVRLTPQECETVDARVTEQLAAVIGSAVAVQVCVRVFPDVLEVDVLRCGQPPRIGTSAANARYGTRCFVSKRYPPALDSPSPQALTGNGRCGRAVADRIPRQ